jgi:excisionase family DNA binding protein
MKFLTVQEVADRLRLSESMIYKEINAGRLPHYRFGARVRITEGGLDEYVRDQLAESGPRPECSPTSHLDL